MVPLVRTHSEVCTWYLLSFPLIPGLRVFKGSYSKDMYFGSIFMVLLHLEPSRVEESLHRGTGVSNGRFHIIVGSWS